MANDNTGCVHRLKGVKKDWIDMPIIDLHTAKEEFV